MTTGKVPFDADTPVSVALKHMQETPKEPININPAIPLAVNKIIMKAMKKDPGLRYQSATEMLKDLTLALKNPDGDFVSVGLTDEDFPTQVVPTLENKNIEDKIKEEDNKNGKKQNFFKKHKALTIIIILILLFVLSLGGTSLLFNMTKSKDVQVPNLVGLTIDEAKSKLDGTKLEYEVAEEKYDSKVDAGLIISQNPEFKSNYMIKENTKIEVVVSLGQKIVKVPKVVGMEEEKAKEALKKEDLEVVIVEEFNKKVEAGFVISQDVEADKEVEAGATVTITVSKGIEEASVPNVVGKTQEVAVKELTDAGFTITATLTDQDTTKEDGTILKQSLDAGSTVEKGANITITVNQIQQLVNGTAIINLKSVLNYTPKYTNTSSSGEGGSQTGSTEINPKNVKVRVVVGDDTVYDRSHKENETNVKVGFTGVGTVTVKLYVDDILKSTKQVNLNREQTVTFE